MEGIRMLAQWWFDFPCFMFYVVGVVSRALCMFRISSMPPLGTTLGRVCVCVSVGLNA